MLACGERAEEPTAALRVARADGTQMNSRLWNEAEGEGRAWLGLAGRW